jgi:hypothetical protein
MLLFVGTAVGEMTEARKRFLVRWRPYDPICIGLARKGGRVLSSWLSARVHRRVKPVRVRGGLALDMAEVALYIAKTIASGARKGAFLPDLSDFY